MKKKLILSLMLFSLFSISFSACGKNSDESADNTSVSALETETKNETVSLLKDGWNYSALYFSCPDFDIKGGSIAWNEKNGEWEAEFSSPYMYTVLDGTFTKDGTLTLENDNTSGNGEAYIPGLQDELNNLRNGLKYAYLAFSCPDFDITGGVFAWNEKTNEWKAEFPTPYMYTTLGGTYKDETLTLTEDNTAGHAEPYLPGLEEAFTEILSGNYQAPLNFENEESNISDGIISWNVNEKTWKATYNETSLEGTYESDGALTFNDNNIDDQTKTSIQEAFIQALKGIYGNPENAEVADLNDLIASYPGNAEEYSFDDISEMENSPLSGKSICILGSSVAFGQASQESAVGEYLAARFGASLTKETVSGTTLADNDETSYVERMVNNLDPEADFDLFICQLSTNDASKKIPLGEISDSKNMEDFDTTTVTGAIEYIISYAQKTWNCPVVFFTGSHYDSPEYDAMVTRIEALKDKWGIGVLNLWSDEAFNNISDEDRALYMSDDIHPTKAGYKIWWGPELEKQLLDYLN